MSFFVIFFVLFFCCSSPAQAIEWHEVNPDPMATWQVSGAEITGLMLQPIGNSFLITDEAEFPPKADFIWQVEWLPQQGSDHNLVWGFIDEKNYYQLHFAQGSVWVDRFINGQQLLGNGVSFSWQLGQSYLIKIKRTNGLLSIFINNYEVFHFNDLTYNTVTSQGDWGFKLAAGTVIPVKTIFRNSEFFTKDFFILPLRKYLQTDPLWSDDHYDHAESWSTEPTISRWGCALSSVAMVLDYHGFKTLPNGEPLNPQTLNTWLKNQPDGYLGKGLVNWWAITRLVKTLSDQSNNNLPKLEFAVVKQNLTAQLDFLLKNKLPVIAQLPGHFVVVNGWLEQSDDFIITDPLDQKTRLNAYGKLLSLRTFQPSFTDLSYLVVAHTPETAVVIKDLSGNELPVAVLEEQIFTGQTLFLTILAKPTEGNYVLEFSNLQSLALPKVLAYADTAEVTEFSLENNNLTKQKIILDFKKNRPSAITYLLSWDDFLTAVETAFQHQLISLTAKTRIVERVKLIQQAENTTAYDRQVNYLTNLLSFYGKFFDQATSEQLKTMVTVLASQPK